MQVKYKSSTMASPGEDITALLRVYIADHLSGIYETTVRGAARVAQGETPKSVIATPARNLAAPAAPITEIKSGAGPSPSPDPGLPSSPSSSDLGATAAVCAAKCTLAEAGFPVLLLGQTATISVVARSETGGRLAGAEVKFKAASQTATVAATEDLKGAAGSFTVSAGKAGLHSVEVTLDGVHIQGSPFSLQVLEPLPASVTSKTAPKLFDFFGFEGNADGQMQEPRGCALTPDQKGIYVAERGNNRVHVWTVAGQSRRFGQKGTEPGQFSQPTCCLVDGDGSVLVGDPGNHR